MDGRNELLLAGHQCPLPFEIILDILLNLHVKSLLRFKCVSKSWRSLISDTNFATLHAKKAVDDRQVFLQRRRVMFTDRYDHPYSIDLDRFLQDHSKNLRSNFVTATQLDFYPKELDPNTNHPSKPFSYINSLYFCNHNLVMCKTSSGFYLVNPATREAKRVPDLPVSRLSSPSNSYFFEGTCGFGFDHINNDYKVVFMQRYNFGEIVYGLYSLKANSWRDIERHRRYVPRFHESGVFFNGAIHWLAGDDDGRSVILSFVLAEERFQEIALPTIHDNIIYRSVGVFTDCLCVILRVIRHYANANYDPIWGNDNYDEFWVMKEYRVNESWTKIRSAFNSSHWSSGLLQTGFSTKSHDVIVHEKEQALYVYEDFGMKGKKLRIRGRPTVGRYAGVYVEGLFPLAKPL